MLDGLSGKLSSVFNKLRNRGKITEGDLDKTLREIKLILLEADVNFKIVGDFISAVKEEAVGQDITKSLRPEHIIIKAVNDNLIKILSYENSELIIKGNPAIIMMVGLQGTGKTTTCGKLALLLQKTDKKCLLVPCDIKRPAAYEQLRTVAHNAGAGFFEERGENIIPIIKNAINYGKRELFDILILDTAGRLHIDDELMKELSDIENNVKPSEILYIGDALTGQDAVKSAQGFNEHIDITGIILTKLDGDQKGGAALSIVQTVKKPIKYICTGEHINNIEKFHPDRLASRILGMGDIVSLVEKTQEMVSEDQAREMEKKLKKGEFNFQDYLDQIKQIKKMGPLSDILKMIPGVGGKLKLTGMEGDQLKKVESVISSMTPKERRNPHLLNNKNRARRIAKGSGNTVAMVKFVIKQHKQMKKMMKKMSKDGMPNFM